MKPHWSIISLALVLCFAREGFGEPNRECKFLNEACDDPPQAQRRADQNLSDAEHLRRCLAEYVRINGPFVPEGQSTAIVKSRSDMTAMCKHAIKVKNYYWSYPNNPDPEANMRCCIN